MNDPVLENVLKRLPGDCVLLWEEDGAMSLYTSFDDLPTLQRFHSTLTAFVAKRIAREHDPETAGAYLGRVCGAAVEGLRTRLGGRKKNA